MQQNNQITLRMHNRHIASMQVRRSIQMVWGPWNNLGAKAALLRLLTMRFYPERKKIDIYDTIRNDDFDSLNYWTKTRCCSYQSATAKFRIAVLQSNLLMYSISEIFISFVFPSSKNTA